MRKTGIGLKCSIVGLATAIVLMGSLSFYLLCPSQYLALDVNPSIELQTNRLGNVVSLSGANEDARVLLAGYVAGGKKLDVVLTQVVDRLVESGYIAEGQTNDILITSQKGSGADKTLQEVGKKVQQELTKHQLTGEISTQSIALDPAVEKAAAAHQVSAGKMMVIDQLVQQDSKLSAEALVDTRISDLLAYAQTNQISLDALENHLEALQATDGDNAHLEELEEGVDDAKDAAEEAQDEKAEAEEEAQDAAEEAAEEAKDAAEEAQDEKAEAEEEARDAAEEAADLAKDAADKAKDAAEEAQDEKAEAEEEAQDAAEEAADLAKDAAEEAKDAAEDKKEAEQDESDEADEADEGDEE